jgi:hypothetical protein
MKMKTKIAQFKTTSAWGYPVRIIGLMNRDGIFYIIQRFLIPANEVGEWDHFTVLRVFKEVALVENRLGFQENTFIETMKLWALLMDKWNENENKHN